MLGRAERCFAQYDYEKAMELVRSDPETTVRNRTSDLFNAEEVFEPARPTPVPSY